MCWWCPILIISGRGCLAVEHGDEWDISVEYLIFFLDFIHFKVKWSFTYNDLTHPLPINLTDENACVQKHCISQLLSSPVGVGISTDQYIAKIRFSMWFMGKNGKTDAPRTNLPSWTGNMRRDSSSQFVSYICFRLLTGRSTAAGSSMLYLCSIHKDSVTHVKAIHSLWRTIHISAHSDSNLLSSSTDNAKKESTG